jgi:hypothetical protein
VKSYYNPIEEWGVLRICRDRLIISVADKTHTYDGKEYTHYEPVLVSGTLLPSDDFVVEDIAVYNSKDKKVIPKGVGTYKVIITECKVLRNGVETADYLIEYQQGTLQILPRLITIRMLDDEKYFDNRALTSSAAVCQNLVVGHNVYLEGTGSITEPGTTKNAVRADSVIIYDENGRPVTENYTFNFQEGKLTIWKRPVVLSPLSIEKMYDGAVISYPAGMENSEKMTIDWNNPEESWMHYYSQPLLTGYSLTANDVCFAKSFAEVGSTTISLVNGRILNSQGVDVTDKYYEVSYATATGRIVQASLEVASKTIRKTDDGTALVGSENDCYIVKGSLPSGHTIEYTVSAKLTGVGECVNRIVKVVIKNGSKIVGYYECDAYGRLIAGNDSRYNYKIIVTCGELKISSKE